MIFAAFFIIVTVGVWAFLGAWLVGELATRGTRLRYICRSIVGPTQWVAIGYMAIYLVLNIVRHRWGFVLLDIWNCYWISREIRKYYNSDEDDFWKRTKKKLRKLVRATMRRARALKPARPVPAAGGGVA